MVEIEINGEPRKVVSGLTIAQLLTEMQLAGPAVAVEVNLELVPRARHAEHALQAGDKLEIVTFKGGG